MSKEKYPNGTKTVEETKEYLAAQRYIMRLHIDSDTWFTTTIVNMDEVKIVENAVFKDEHLWRLSYKDTSTRECVVKGSKIAWISFENAEPVYDQEDI